MRAHLTKIYQPANLILVRFINWFLQDLNRELHNKSIRALILMVFLLFALSLSLQQLSQRQIYQQNAAAPASPLCYKPCSDDSECRPGFVCGSQWCPPGNKCNELLRCYNPDCPFNNSCNCPTK